MFDIAKYDEHHDHISSMIKESGISSLRSKEEALNFLNWIHASLKDTLNFNGKVHYRRSFGKKILSFKNVEIVLEHDGYSRVARVGYCASMYEKDLSLFGVLKAHEDTFPLNIIKPVTEFVFKEKDILIWDKTIDLLVFTQMTRLVHLFAAVFEKEN